MQRSEQPGDNEHALRREAGAYLHSHPAILELCRKFAEKYRSLGRWGGSVSLAGLTPEERAELAAFLRQAPEGSRLSFEALCRAWSKTRFGSLSLPRVVAEVLPDYLQTKKEAASRQEQSWRRDVLKVYRAYPEGKAGRWLEAILLGHFRWHEIGAEAVSALRLTARALASLPVGKRYERLPFFANRLCGQPHALDENTEAGKLFCRALSYLGGGRLSPSQVEARTELLYEAHILRDDLLNQVTVYGLRAFMQMEEPADGWCERLYWRQAAQDMAPLNVPLREITKADVFCPWEKGSECNAGLLETGKTAEADWPCYIVENAGVFSALLDELQERGLRKPLICLHGQPKTASWALLDRLTDSGARIYYSGDYDPEGLSIADKVLMRCPGSRLWHMGTNEYGQTGEKIPVRRLSQLQGLQDQALRELAVRLRECGTAFYQESLLEALLEDLLA
mgnify:CR=1 FL=1